MRRWLREEAVVGMVKAVAGCRLSALLLPCASDGGGEGEEGGGEFRQGRGRVPTAPVLNPRPAPPASCSSGEARRMKGLSKNLPAPAPTPNPRPPKHR